MKTKIYFLPGTLCDARLWLELWAALSEMDNRYQLIHLSIPAQKNIDDIVLALAEQLPEEKINLLGFSQGGYLASAFACQYPQRINTLINLSNAPNKLPDAEVVTRDKIILWVEAQGYSGITLARIKTFLHVNNHSNAKIIERIKQMDTHFGQLGLLQQLKSTTVRKNLLPQLQDAKFPMIFCYGDSDLLVKSETIEKLSSTNPVISHYQFVNCGHMLPLEQPYLLAQTLSNFLTRHTS
ncbi:MAG: alpha/beta hydrolase [Colwellia sp.]|nr:alpha/beta hydrolase [Colwellia sp.]